MCKRAGEGAAQAVEMTDLWKARKAKIRLSALPTSPWKSRTQRGFPHFHRSGDGSLSTEKNHPQEELWAVEKWKSRVRIPTFPRPRQPAAQGKTHFKKERSNPLHPRFVDRFRPYNRKSAAPRPECVRTTLQPRLRLGDPPSLSPQPAQYPYPPCLPLPSAILCLMLAESLESQRCV
jgi:hypothetical protein